MHIHRDELSKIILQIRFTSVFEIMLLFHSRLGDIVFILEWSQQML